MPVDSPFGILLRRYRRAAGLTQEDLAERTTLSVRAISDLERGVNRTARSHTVRALAEALGLSGPERLSFEAAGRGSAERPATSAADWSVAGTPLARTTLVGRDGDLAGISGLLGRTCVLTLCGPPGVGKTRLALAVKAAEEGSYRDRAEVVSFSALQDPGMVLVHLAVKLGVTAEQTENPAQALARVLSGRQQLLVLDNLEHLLAAIPGLAALLESCPGITVLATSRHSLGLPGEVIWPVAPLQVAPPGVRALKDLLAIPSVQLFTEAATFSDPSFALTAANAPVVADICRRLDGLPLAIELAAARVRLMGVAAIRKRLDRRLQVLSAGPDALDRTWALRECIGWSYDLLDEADQRFVRLLSAFPGGATIGAVADVAGLDEGTVLDGLDVLVQHSLAAPDTDPDGEPRLRMLEAIREFGLERLAGSGGADAVRAALTRYYVRLGEEAEPQLNGGEQGEWRKRLEQEHDNLREVLGRAVSEHDPAGVQLAGALWRFWLGHGHDPEGMRWLDETLGAVRPPADGASLCDDERAELGFRARALNGAGALSYMQGDELLARSRYEEAVLTWQRLGNEDATAGPLTNLAMLAHYGGDPDEAERLYRQAVSRARAAGNTHGAAHALINFGTLVTGFGRPEEAIAMLEEAASLFRRAGDRRSEAAALGALAAARAGQGLYQQARAVCRHVLEVFEELGHTMGVQEALITLGKIDACEGDSSAAASRFTQALAMSEQDGDPWGTANAHAELARLALYYDGDHDAARQHAETALQLCVQVKYPAGAAAALAVLGGLAARGGQAERSLSYCREGLATAVPTRDQASLAALLELAAYVMTRQGNPEPAGLLLGVASGLRPPTRADVEARFADEARAWLSAALDPQELAALLQRGRELGLSGVAALMAGLDPAVAT